MISPTQSDPCGRSLRLDDGDLALAEGDLVEIDGEANLVQALTLRVLTPYGSDRFNSRYGLDVTAAFTQPFATRTVAEVLKLNLVRTLGTDPRVLDIRHITFDDDAGGSSRRVWTARVELDTVLDGALSLTVDVRP